MTTPPTRRSPSGWRDRIGLGGGTVAALLGVVLVVIGLIGFASAGSDNGSADRTQAGRHTLNVEQRQLDNARASVLRTANQLAADVQSVDRAAGDVESTINAVVVAFNHAVDLANAGDLDGARAAFGTQADPIAGLDAKSMLAQTTLADAQERFAELQAKQGAS
jgi:hypothetical protein